MNFLQGLLGALGGIAKERVAYADAQEKARLAMEREERERQFRLELLEKRFNNEVALKDYEHKLRTEEQSNDPYKRALGAQAEATAELTTLKANLVKACAGGDQEACATLDRINGRKQKRMTLSEFEKAVYGNSSAPEEKNKITNADVNLIKLKCTDAAGFIDQGCVQREISALTGTTAASKLSLDMLVKDLLSQPGAGGGFPPLGGE